VTLVTPPPSRIGSGVRIAHGDDMVRVRVVTIRRFTVGIGRTVCTVAVCALYGIILPFVVVLRVIVVEGRLLAAANRSALEEIPRIQGMADSDRLQALPSTIVAEI
jgi:hypothetical protein